MRKSLIITVVIVLLCLCGCEAVVTVPESPELTRASEMLLTTTAAEESTDKLEATTTSSVEIDVPEKNEEESGTPTEDVVSVDNKADLAEKNGLVSSESTVPSFEEVKADKPSEQTETQLSAPSEPPRETEQSKPTEQPVATEPDEAPAEPPAPTEPTAITEPPIPSETEPPVETQPKTAYDYEFDINAIRSDCIAIGQGIVPDDQTAAIEWNKVTNKSFDNDLKRGDLKVTKTAEDGLNEGLKFHLYGTSYSGITVDEYAVTDASGVATFSSILIGTGYTLEEVETPIRYVVPDNQTAAIEWNKVTNKSFDNVLKKWNLTVTKQDVETDSAQGDANLAGAKYGIYKGDELIDTYVTDADGKFTTKYYVCGTDWSIKELDSSEGYLVTPGNEQIGVDPKNYTAEYNSEAMRYPSD